jgi:hypothetical protein
MKIKKRRSLTLLLTSALIAMPIAAIGTVFPAGSLLTSFNNDGVAVVGQPDVTNMNAGTRAAAMDGQGRVVYGLVEEPGQNVNLAYIERMLATGEHDTSFDRGYITCPTNNETASWVTDVEVDSIGNVYALVDCGLPMVVKLRHTDGFYEISFADDGFLNINAGRAVGAFFASALALDAQGNIYVLGHDYQTNNFNSASSDNNKILKFGPSGVPANIPGVAGNAKSLPNGMDAALITTEDDVVGLMEFDPWSNSLIIGGVHEVAQDEPKDLFLTRLDLDSGALRWDSNNLLWISGFPSQLTWHLVPFDLTVDRNGWISVGGKEWITQFTDEPSFVVQARPVESGQSYSLEQNGPIWLETDDAGSVCWVESVMADEDNRLYAAGSCNGSSFVKRFRSDGTLDSTFTGLETNIAGGVQGSYQPRYLLDTGDELAVFGTGSSDSWPALAFVSKYRTSSFDDSPPPPVVVPAPVAAPAPVVAPAPPVVAAAPAAPAQPTMAIKQKTSGVSLATQIGMTVTPKAKVKLTVAKASKKICKVSGGKLVALKPGNCSVTVSVTPKKTKQVKKPKTSKKVTVVTIS